MKPLPLVVNLVGYQCAWLACVIGAARQLPAFALAVAVAVMLLHLSTAAQPLRELVLIGIAAATGLLFETGLVASGWVRINEATLLGGSVPFLMVALWGVFATTLNVALRSLRRRYLLSALLAAVGAPLAYLAGSRLGAIQWVETLPALTLISVGWAIQQPLLMRSAQRFDGFARPGCPACTGCRPCPGCWRWAWLPGWCRA
jgi:hypothetical protein